MSTVNDEYGPFEPGATSVCSLDSLQVWNLAVKGKPMCSICLDLALRPVFLPCKCKTLICFECFQKFMDKFSACLICRERIVSRLRRECKKDGLKAMVNDDLDQWIRKQFPSEVTLIVRGEMPLCLTESRSAEESAARRVRMMPPEPGELKREIENLMLKHAEQRRAEELASIKLIESLKQDGDEDVRRIEQLQSDEAMARKLLADEDASAAPVSKFVTRPILDRVVVSISTSSFGGFAVAKKLKSSAAAPPPRTKWACKSCTMENDCIWLHCETCGESKNFFKQTSGT